MPSERRLLSAGLLCIAAPAISFGCFALVYGSEAFLCMRAGPSSHRTFAIAATVISVVALMLVARANWRHASVSKSKGSTERFLGRTGIVLAAISTVAVLWLMLPAWLLEACLPPA